jgi:Flp pilus assembly protein TadG
VARHGQDGIGFNFMVQREQERKALKRFMGSAAKLGSVGGDQGQALVEFVAVIPMLFLLIALAFNFGTWLYGWVAMGNVARAAGDYAIMGGAYAGLPPTATAATLQSLVTTELTHLPNQNTAKACVRQNDNGVITTLLDMPSGTCASYSNPPADTEATAPGGTRTYPNLAVDVTYTYTSFFTGTTILGLPLTVLPGTIHRRAVMRLLQ